MKNISLNYPIQSSAADMTKHALIIVYEKLIEQNLLGPVKIVNVVHDEIIMECPMFMSQQIADLLVNSMITAGDFYSSIKMEVEYVISSSWKH